MRGLRKPSTELDNLSAGLGSAEDPYCLQPLAERSLEELAEEVHTEVRYSALSMLRAGRCLMAIKKRLGHGTWEEFVQERHWSWNYVRASMKLLEVVARFPHLVHLPSGTVAARLLRLSLPKIEEVVDGLPPEAIKKLTPWDLERIYHQQKLEDSKLRGRKKRTPEQETALREEAARIKAEMEADPGWIKIMGLWSEAIGALAKLADALGKFELQEKHYDQVFDRDMQAPLQRELDRIRERWRPIDEVRRHATIMERPSFARK